VVAGLGWEAREKINAEVAEERRGHGGLARDLLLCGVLGITQDPTCKVGMWGTRVEEGFLAGLVGVVRA
jgi:hypothetical protein